MEEAAYMEGAYPGVGRVLRVLQLGKREVGRDAVSYTHLKSVQKNWFTWIQMLSWKKNAMMVSMPYVPI